MKKNHKKGLEIANQFEKNIAGKWYLFFFSFLKYQVQYIFLCNLGCLLIAKNMLFDFKIAKYEFPMPLIVILRTFSLPNK